MTYTTCRHPDVPYDRDRVRYLFDRFVRMVEEHGLPAGGWIVSVDICGQRIMERSESLAMIYGRARSNDERWLHCDPTLPPNTIMMARGD